MVDLRIGLGYDTHRLEEPGEKFVLGGVEIPYHKHWVAHSDGDILIHAVIDALFGALGEKDIGSHFPDKDPRYKGADSRRLLEETMECVARKGFEVVNIDTTIIMEEPKIAPYIDEIKASLSPLLAIPQERVSVKAKTNEKIGEVGENRASQAYAVVLLRSKL